MDTVGDNKLSMKCFEINIFFFLGGRGWFSFPLWYARNRLFVFQLLSPWMNGNVCACFPSPLFFSRLLPGVKTLKNYDTLEIRQSIINIIARQNFFRIFVCHFTYRTVIRFLAQREISKKSKQIRIFDENFDFQVKIYSSRNFVENCKLIANWIIFHMTRAREENRGNLRNSSEKYSWNDLIS